MRGDSIESIEACNALEEAQGQGHPEHGIKMALVGIGYALLDIAQAVREGHE